MYFMYKVIGIDEAGKGPVIGSMFIGFAIITLETLQDLNSFQDMLKSIGVKDSKQFTPKNRNNVYQELKKNIDMKYVQLTPAAIDLNNSRGGKLNELEVQGIITILETEKPQLVIIDALTSRPDKFGSDILKRLSFECKIISENKADVNYPIVGAASIIAKELREQEVEQIKKNIGVNCGSGYPSDPNTIEFLKNNWNNKEYDFIFRKSWETYKNLSKPKHKTLNDF